MLQNVVSSNYSFGKTILYIYEYEGLLTMVPGIFFSKHNDGQLDGEGHGQLHDTEQVSEDVREYVLELQRQAEEVQTKTPSYNRTGPIVNLGGNVLSLESSSSESDSSSKKNARHSDSESSKTGCNKKLKLNEPTVNMNNNDVIPGADDNEEQNDAEEAVVEVVAEEEEHKVEITTSRIGVNFNNRKEVSGVFQGAFIVSILDYCEYKQYFKVDDEIIEVAGTKVSNKSEANVAILEARTKLPYSLQLKRKIVAPPPPPLPLEAGEEAADSKSIDQIEKK